MRLTMTIATKEDWQLPVDVLEVPPVAVDMYVEGVLDGFHRNFDPYSEDDAYLSGIMFGKFLMFNYEPEEEEFEDE